MTSLRVEHELHRRRRSRNFGLGLTLAALIAVVFGLSVVKVSTLGPTQGFDHVVRPEMLEEGR